MPSAVLLAIVIYIFGFAPPVAWTDGERAFCNYACVVVSEDGRELARGPVDARFPGERPVIRG